VLTKSRATPAWRGSESASLSESQGEPWGAIRPGADFNDFKNSHTQCNNLCDVESRNGTARRSQAVKSPANRCGFFFTGLDRKEKRPLQSKERPVPKTSALRLFHYLDHLDLFKVKRPLSWVRERRMIQTTHDDAVITIKVRKNRRSGKDRKQRLGDKQDVPKCHRQRDSVNN